MLTIHYDKSDGFYRRQLLLTTRDKADGREDDPFLIDKMKQEKEGIFLWGLEGICTNFIKSKEAAVGYVFVFQ